MKHLLSHHRNSLSIAARLAFVLLTVVASHAQTPPTVAIAAPGPGATYLGPGTVPIAVNASAASGRSITNVKIYDAATLLTTLASAPYGYEWKNVAAGSHTLTAEAEDSAGAKTTSSAVALTVTAPPPSLGLYHPAPNEQVLLSAQAETTGQPRIILRFPLTKPMSADVTIKEYRIYRRLKGQNDWGAPIAVLADITATQYSDYVSLGSAYEYRVDRHLSDYTYCSGYVYAGIQAVPYIHNRGKILLLTDSSVFTTEALINALARLEADLAGDGWTVVRHSVERGTNFLDGPVSNDPQGYADYVAANRLQVQRVKAIVKAEYDCDPANARAVFLLGRVPVPYSGIVASVGHGDHCGAWATDLYYGEVTSPWGPLPTGWQDSQLTENTVRAKNRNLPEDGKFDNDDLPSTAELMVGRVDFSGMYGLGNGNETVDATERRLLLRYLDKNQQFRHGQLLAKPRAYIHNRLRPDYAKASYRTFFSLFGSSPTDGIVQFEPGGMIWIDYLTSCEDIFLWSLASSGAHFTLLEDCIGGDCPDGDLDNIGYLRSSRFNLDNPKTIFSVWFGSYMADWDHADNFLRAALAPTDHILGSLWRGPGKLALHHMALGEPVGYSMLAMQNDGWPIADHDVAASYMGDPTLRLHSIVPPASVNLTQSANEVTVRWSAPASPPANWVGYYVYRGPDRLGPFTRLTPQPIPLETTAYSDSDFSWSDRYYMVQCVALEQGFSGSYLNTSQGVFADLSEETAPEIVTQPANRWVSPGRAAALTVHAIGKPALTYAWQRQVGSVWQTIPGASQSAYVIDSAAPSDEGCYRVVVSNTAGSVESSTVTVNINHPPGADPDWIFVMEGTSTLIDGLSYGTFGWDEDEAPIPYTFDAIMRQPAHGFVELVPDSANPGRCTAFRYTAPSGYVGTDTFDYAVSDGETSVVATVTVTVVASSATAGLSKCGSPNEFMTSADIGPVVPTCDPLVPCGRVLADGSWEIRGGFGDSTTDGHFEYEELNNNFEVRVRSLSVNSCYGRAGLMLREGMGSGARCAYIGLLIGDSPGLPIVHACRREQIEEVVHHEIPIQPTTPWLGIRRTGDQVRLFWSNDGQNWTQVGQTLAFPGLTQTLAVGLFANGSTETGDAMQAVFSDYSCRVVTSPADSVFFDLILSGESIDNNNLFSFQIDGPVGAVCSVQASTDLESWTSVGSPVTLTSGSATFSWPADAPYRFFWVRSGLLHCVNVIGYMKTEIPTGDTFFTSQLNHLPNNSVSEVLSAASGVVDGTGLLWLTSGGWFGNTYIDEMGWVYPEQQCLPGKAFLIQSVTPFTLKVTGEVPQGIRVVDLPGANGADYLASPFPKAVPLVAANSLVNGFGARLGSSTGGAGDRVSVWDGGTLSFGAAYEYEMIASGTQSGWLHPQLGNVSPLLPVGGVLLFQSYETTSSGGLGGKWACSLMLDPLIPAAPSGLSAHDYSPLLATLNWQDNSDTEESVEIWRGVNGDPKILRWTLSANATSFQDPLETPGATYTYVVRATNRRGSSVWSNTAIVAP